MQAIKESYSQNTILLNKDIQDKLALLKGNVTQFALENIKLELLAIKKASIGHVSHAVSNQPCLCKLRKNYRLLCRHLLVKYEDEAIPLNAIHQRWRISYSHGKGML